MDLIQPEAHFDQRHFRFSEVCHLKTDPRFQSLTEEIESYGLGEFYGLATHRGEQGTYLFVLIFDKLQRKSLALIPNRSEFGTPHDLATMAKPIRPQGFEVCLIYGLYIAADEAFMQSLQNTPLNPDLLDSDSILPKWGPVHCCAVTDGNCTAISQCRATLKLPCWKG